MKIRIPVPLSGGLVLSYRCTARCRHCIYGCSQRWSGDWIKEEDLQMVLSNLAGKIRPAPWGRNSVGLNEGLHFTGGEPFMNFELLLKAVEIANELKIPSTFVETNCFWATDDRKTKEKLRLLKAKGLKGIMISVNPFYLEYVPFERTERAIRIALKVFGRNVMVYQLEYYRRFRLYGFKDRVSLEDYLRIEGKENFLRDVEFFVMGRAPYMLRDLIKDLYPPRPARYYFNRPCITPFLRSLHNHFDNYGNLVPGFCGGISLGDCRRLEELLTEGIDTAEHPVLGYLINSDFQGLYNFARERGFEEDPEGYLSKCHLCTDIRSFLALNFDFPELRPKEFYMHLKE